MSDAPTSIIDLTKRGAALRLREIAHELHLLLELFPDLENAFDEDELPVSFILRRDARGTRSPAGSPGQASRAAARSAVNRRMKQVWTARRAGSKS